MSYALEEREQSPADFFCGDWVLTLQQEGWHLVAYVRDEALGRALVAKLAAAEDMAAALEDAALDLHGYHGAQQPYAECEWGGCVEHRVVLAAWRKASGAASASPESPAGRDTSATGHGGQWDAGESQ